MTTVAYRDGVIAAERDTKSQGVVWHETTKIARRGDGALIGCAGLTTLGAGVRRWFLAGEPEPRPNFGTNDSDDVHAIIVRPDGTVEIHDRMGWSIAEGDFIALGTGYEIAIGAMEMGATAEQAVRIAAKRGVGRQDAIDILRREPPRALGLVKE